jgi:methyl-accepting chemotaxis protein
MESTSGPLEPKRVRRRTFLIDRKFQVKYTLVIVAVGVVVSFLLGFFIIQKTRENSALLQMDQVLAEQVQKFDNFAIYYLAGFVVVMAVALFFWGIFITHRVAGPIFIISRYLREIGEGEAPRTRPLRRGDELKEFFDTFSFMLSGLKRKHVEEAEVLDKAVAEIQKSGNQALAPVAKDLAALSAKKKTWGEGSVGP